MTLAFVFDSVGAGEWLMLLAVLLVVIGPKRLPGVLRKFGSQYAKPVAQTAMKYASQALKAH